MLKGIDPLLNADLLHLLAAAGHGDEIVIVDANFPATSVANRLVRHDGVDAVRVLRAVLTLFPLDSFVPDPAQVMQVVGDPGAVPPVVQEFQAACDAAEGRPVTIGRLERFAFYERAKACFALVSTGERRLYGNIILKKGVIPPA
jgi:L-fucose mutarotase